MVSIVFARDATNRPTPANVIEPYESNQYDTAVTARDGHAEQQFCRDQQEEHLGDEEHDPAAHQRDQKMAPPHRSGHHPFQHVLHPQVHGVKPDTPHPGAHQIHPDQAGDQEVDVAGTRRIGSPVVRTDCVFAACRTLDRIVHHGSRRGPAGIRRIEEIFEISRRVDGNNERCPVAA